MKKHITNIALSGLVELLRSNKQKIVFTNGCFDILHPGHIDYLQKAKNLGDVLILGLNSDKSIKSLKGVDRPINKLSDRLKMLDALEAVDFVIPSYNPTAIQNLKTIKPSFYTKGPDYISKPDITQNLNEEKKALKKLKVKFILLKGLNIAQAH